MNTNEFARILLTWIKSFLSRTYLRIVCGCVR